MKIFNRQGWGRTLLLTVATMYVVAGVAVGQIDITNKFTDENFRAVVYNRIGKTAPAPILDSDVRDMTTISISAGGIISNLSGIEYFTALKRLECGMNLLTTLDVSKNTTLTYLYCTYNQLTTLDVSKEYRADVIGLRIQPIDCA
jgi:hypothetical protein